MGRDNLSRRNLQSLRSRDKIGFVIDQEFQHRSKNAAIAQPVPQYVGSQTSKIKQTVGARLVAQALKSRASNGLVRGIRMARELSASCKGHMGIAMEARVKSTMAKRILVVEDNDLNRKLFCDVLKANGFEVEPVADGEIALNAARAFAPDLVIMDIQLPNISGIDLIAAFKQDTTLRSAPILAVTAYAGKGDEDRIRDAGAESYLSKPVSINPFMAAVKELLGN